MFQALFAFLFGARPSAVEAGLVHLAQQQPDLVQIARTAVYRILDLPLSMTKDGAFQIVKLEDTTDLCAEAVYVKEGVLKRGDLALLCVDLIRYYHLQGDA